MRGAMEIADVVVVGAGPAGSAAAQQCALRGLRTVLIDRKAFPREKVCGCCLSGAACATLEQMGLGSVLDAQRAIAQRTVMLRAGQRSVRARLGDGRILSRGALDAAMMNAARDAGATFCDRTLATELETREDRVVLAVRDDDGVSSISVRVLIVADGLGGHLLDGVLGRRVRRRRGAIGVGTLLSAEASEIERGVVELGLGREGYVGIARVESGAIDVAGAVNPGSVRRAGGVGAVIASIAEQNGMRIEGVGEASWVGTPTLVSRRRRLGARRVFVVGDAAGYLEPITGEGIGWALASGARVAAIAQRAARCWDDGLIGAWERAHREIVRERRGLCASASALLRVPAIARAAVGVLSYHPDVADSLARMTARRFDLNLVRS